MVFNSDPGFVSICGAVVAIGGMSVYTSLNLKRSPEVEGPQLPKHNVPTLKPKTDEGKPEEESSVNVTVSNVV